MQVILLERIAKLGEFGDTVKVRPGFGRNYLIPQGKALTATATNLKYFEERREEIERQHEERRQSSLSRAEKLEKALLRVEVNAAEDGKLYGSVSVRDIVPMLAERGIEVEKREITMPEEHIRQVGEYNVTVTLEGEKVIQVPLEVVAASKPNA